MTVLIATDAWYPQPNGVVRVLGTLRRHLEAQGQPVEIIAPDRFRTVPCPSYPEIRLALWPGRAVARLIDAARPRAIHIATEGPLGLAARRHCLRRNLPFTTAYHTKFPQYVRARTGLPLSWLYAAVRRFHAPSSGILVPSPSLHRELSAVGFANLKSWAHGVDTDTFRPLGKNHLDLERPVFAYIGRLAVEKNIPAFLELDLPGSKLVVGTGPAREALMRRFPKARFVIAHNDDELARLYSSADAFVFPSRTDTFGLVMLEAMACGVPVAAFPVPGPLDVVGLSGAGVLDWDLASAARRALAIDSALCRAHALTFSWTEVARQFLAHLQPIGNENFDGLGRHPDGDR
jgi:glycosyltransferase involved in cell wall biosynthesis